jgi:hypothetical protein
MPVVNEGLGSHRHSPELALFDGCDVQARRQFAVNERQGRRE